MRIYDEYKQTTDRSVYNKLHKMMHARCDYCKWHGEYSENDQWEWYHVYLEDDVNSRWRKKRKKGEGKFPSWKLVSKNQNQWMRKPIVLKRKYSGYFQQWSAEATIKWPIKKRPK